MREIRSYGSAGGRGGNEPLYPEVNTFDDNLSPHWLFSKNCKMKVFYTIGTILLLSLFYSVFNFEAYVVIPFVLMVSGVFGSNFIGMRKKGNSGTFILLFLFLVAYTYLVFFEASSIVIILVNSLSSMLGLLIGATNTNTQTKEEIE